MPADRRMKSAARRFEIEPVLTMIALTMVVLTMVVLLTASCGHAPPLPIDEDWVMQQVSSRYREFFAGPGAAPPDQAAGRRAESPPTLDDETLLQGLLRPRFGLPAIVRAGTAFPIDMLERRAAGESFAPSPRVALLRPEVTPAAATACLNGETVPGCHLLRVEPIADSAAQIDAPIGTADGVTEGDGRALPAGLRRVRYTAYLDSPMLPPPGGYDLLVARGEPGASGLPGPSQAAPVERLPTRAPRAVWLRAEDPMALDKVRVAHLSDLHVGKIEKGKDTQILQRLRQVVGEVNRLAPDLVIITGDIVNSGQQPQLWPIAKELLSEVAAPVLVVLGNHDIEFRQRGVRTVRRYGAGWANFARTFHPFLHFSLSLGGYDFIGFDSGPAEARILTRGLHPASVALLRADMARAQERGQRGVILFSHAPSRASTFNRVLPRSSGFFGRMRYGNAAFESALFEAAARGQTVLHLSGHTHWSDVFELDQPSHQFRRWPLEALSRCPHALRSSVALITTQAAGHPGLFSKANARGYGFSLLTLGGPHPELEVFRYGTATKTETCPHNLATRLADTEIGGKLL